MNYRAGNAKHSASTAIRPIDIKLMYKAVVYTLVNGVIAHKKQQLSNK